MKNRGRGSMPPPELPWSFHKTPGWRGQLERTKRFRDRIKNAKSRIDKEDFLYAFYQNCYHIRDWLEEEIPASEINDYIRRTEELRLCADLCNVTKHYSLSMRPGQGQELSIARVATWLGWGWFEDEINLVVLSQGKKHDLLELAGKCISAWETFLNSRGLL